MLRNTIYKKKQLTFLHVYAENNCNLLIFFHFHLDLRHPSVLHKITHLTYSYQFSSVAQSCPTLCTPWIAAHQTSLSITNSRSSLKLMSTESVVPSSHLILCRPLLLLPPIPPSIGVFSSESTLRMRWPKYLLL